MRSRLGMAAWAIAATAATWAGSARAGETTAVENTVNLELQVSGLGREGCLIEITPAHKACSFRKLEAKVKPGQVADPLKFQPQALVVSSTAADRDCSFTITIKEPGRPPAVFRRGLRLSTRPSGQAKTPTQSLRCYIDTTAVASRDGSKKSRRD